jgi:hypothetical protein
MDEFSYLSVLISVILGLAVTQILKGYFAVADADSHLLASGRLGGLAGTLVAAGSELASSVCVIQP